MLKELFFFLIILVPLKGIAQLTPPNFFDYWQDALTDTELTIDQWNNYVHDGINYFEQQQQSQQGITYPEKLFYRNEWSLDSRMGITPSGEIDLTMYQRAWHNYTEQNICQDDFPEKPWESIGPRQDQLSPGSNMAMGLVSAVHMNPENINEIIVGGSATGIWKTNDKGNHWTCVTDDMSIPVLGVNNFAVHPSNSGLIYASTGITHGFLYNLGVGLLRSTDYGDTWEQVTSLGAEAGAYPHIAKVVFDPGDPNTMYFIAQKKLFKSTDTGYSWNEIVPVTDIGEKFDDILVLESGAIMVVTHPSFTKNYKLWRSIDGGYTWVNKTAELEERADDITEVYYDFTTVPILTWTSTNTWINSTALSNGYLGDMYDSGSYDFDSDGWYTGTFGGETALTIDLGPSQSATITKAPVSIEVDESPLFLNLLVSIPAYSKIELIGLTPYNEFGPVQEVLWVMDNSTSSLPIEIDLSAHELSPVNSKFKGLRFRITTTAAAAVSSTTWIKKVEVYKVPPIGAIRLFKIENTTNKALIAYEHAYSRFIYRGIDDNAGGISFVFRTEVLGSDGDGITGGIRKFEVSESINNPELYYSGAITLWHQEVGLPKALAAVSVSNFHDDVRSMQILEHPVTGDDLILVGHDGGVSLSEDGVSWTSINGNISNSQLFSFHPAPGGEFWVAGAMDNRSFKYEDENLSQICYGDGGVAYVHPYTHNYIVNDPQNNSFCESWPGISNIDDPINNNTYLGMQLESVKSNPDLIWYGLRRKNQDADFAKVISYDASDPASPPVSGNFALSTNKILDIEAYEGNPNIVYATASTDNGIIYHLGKSEDGGATYSPVFIPSTLVHSNEGTSSDPIADVVHYRDIRSVAVSHTNSEKVWVTLDRYVEDESGEVIPGKWRVLKSDPDGPHWNDYSTGLPALPVNKIIYVNGYDDLLFVGTDAGVYYRNNTMQQWECFNHGLPKAPIADLDFDECTKTLYATTFGRGIYKVEIPFYLGELTEADIIVDATTTWDTDRNSNSNIIIQPGVSLTITGTLNMAADKRVVVQQGAKLHVRGGTITNQCGGLWYGIEVWGNTDLDQNTANQGWLVLSNDALLEHAHEAIQAWRPGHWDKTGGIVNIYNSSVKNCKRAVSLMSYSNDIGEVHYPNKAKFIDTDFIWDDDFRREEALEMVSMYKVDGVTFSACRFEDQRTVLEIDKRSHGIHALNTSFSISSSCPLIGGCPDDLTDPSWNLTQFKNLDRAIIIGNAFSINTSTVDHCEFTNNLVDIFVSQSDHTQITKNRFVFTSALPADVSHTTGVLISESTGYRVEENQFISFNASLSTTGVLIAHSGELDNELYKNKFTNLENAVVARGVNRRIEAFGGGEGATGLEFYCNEHTNNRTDFLVGDEGVKKWNGLSLGSGNTFTQNMLLEEDYLNLSENEVYYFYGDNDGAFPTRTPIEVSDNVDITEYTTTYNECFSKLPDYPGGLGNGMSNAQQSSLTNQFWLASQQLQQKITILHSLIDGGNTSSLLNQIANVTQSNVDQLHAQLQSYSPYLSEAVIDAVLQIPAQLFKNHWKRDLILANIEVAYTNGFISSLNLPNHMVVTIQNAVDDHQTTNLTTLQQEISILHKIEANSADLLLGDYKMDSIVLELDSIHSLMSNRFDPLKDLREIDFYLHQNDWNKAMNLTNNLSGTVSAYPAHLQNEVSTFVDLKLNLNQILSVPGMIADLSPQQLGILRYLADNGDGIARAQAENILCFFYGECGDHSLNVELAEQGIMLDDNASIDKLIDEINFLLYPNPANEQVLLMINEFDETQTYYLELTRIDGAVIYERQVLESSTKIDLSDLKKGIYVIALTLNGQSKTAAKLIVQ